MKPSDLVTIQFEHATLYWATCVYLQDRTSITVRDLTNVLLNQWFVGPCFVFGLYQTGWQPVDPTLATRPVSACGYLVTYYLVLCLSFYAIHRLAHSTTICNGFLWRKIHVLHHTYTVTAPCGAFYCHPLEHIGINLVPVLLGPLCLPADLVTVRVWFALCTISSVVAHHGATGPHGIHHRRPNVNFGVGTWLDTLLGTGA